MHSDDKTAITQQGAVVLSHVTRLIDHDDVKVWLVDASTKYAEADYVVSFESNGTLSKHELWFHASNSAMFTQGNPKVPTVLTLDIPTELGWFVIVNGGRYEFQIAAYKHQ